MGRVILDSDILIWHFRNAVPAVAFIDRVSQEHDLSISVLTLAEVEAGARPGELDVVRHALDVLEVLPVTAEIARLAGDYRRTFGPSHGTGLTDCVIAATSTVHDLPLATLNVKHFPMLRGLKRAFRP